MGLSSFRNNQHPIMKQPSERKWFYGYQIVVASSIIQMLYLSLMFSF